VNAPWSEVSLRGVEDADLELFFEHQADLEAAQLVAFATRDHDAFLAHWSKIRADETVYLQAVVVDGIVTGHVVSWVQSEQRIVGYWFGREHWGRGIATKALELFLGQVPTRPLYARVALHNVGSLRVLEKCGFKPALTTSVPVDSDKADGVAEVVLILEA
jgi:RimJ/RimL family protein N-acetyltransferase